MANDQSSSSRVRASNQTFGTDRWPVFFVQMQRGFLVVLYVFLWLTGFRVLMLAIFSGRLAPDTDLSMIRKCMLVGARFDISVATYWAIPVFLVGLATLFGLGDGSADKVRVWIGRLFAVVNTFLSIVAIGFFWEFKDHFNHWIFGVVFDDFGAVLKTIWASYPAIPALLCFVGCSWMTWRLFQAFTSKPVVSESDLGAYLNTWFRKAPAGALIITAILLGARGSISSRPVQLKDAAVTPDPVLNKMVINPYSALRYAIADQLRLMYGTDFHVVWPSGNVAEAAQVAFPGHSDYASIDKLTERVAKGPLGVPPKHIFLIVMESYDAWPLLDSYRSLGLAEGVRALAQEGALIRAFVSAGTGTMTSFGVLVTGLPEVGAVVNYQPASKKPFPTSITTIFEQLGYRTRVFYAGYLSWQRFGDFCAEQGFDEVYGGGHMVKGRLSREWGVEDDQLFDFVLGKLDPDIPSLNVILTAGYHPPFTTDVYGKGFPLRSVPQDIRRLWGDTVNFVTLGHLWFSDQCLSNFIVRVEQRLPFPLFAVTGDHWSRHFINGRPNAYERSAVLMLWRGKGVLPESTDPSRIAGSHLDIIPTLVELSAPQGFHYHAFGSNLFDPHRQQVGWGAHATVGPDFIVSHAKPDEALLLWEMRSRPVSPAEQRLVVQGRALRALAWWRLIKGPHVTITKR